MSSNVGSKLCLVFMIFGVFSGVAAWSSETTKWSEFRGADRSGISDDTGLLRQWPEAGPNELWRRPIGVGFSGIVVVGDRLWTQAGDGNAEMLLALDAETGQELWHLPLGELFRDEFGDGPRATPAVVEGVEGEVYAVSSRGQVVAASLDGKELWRLDLAREFPMVVPQMGLTGEPMMGLEAPIWGHSSSPMVHGPLLIVQTGAGGGRSLVALDRKTGQERWQALDTAAGYSSPTLMSLSGREQIVFLETLAAVGLDPDNGRELWRQPWQPTMAQPLQVGPDRVFLSTASDVGAVVFTVQEKSVQEESVQKKYGQIVTEQVWRNREIKNMWSSTLFYQGLLFGFDNATLKCLAPEDGTLKWARRGYGKGSLIAADGLLVVLSDRGLLALLEAKEADVRELGRWQALNGRSWTAPSMAGGRLFLRNHEEIVAIRMTSSGDD